MDNHFASSSMCRRDAASILKNGGGRSNHENQYYIGHIESLCEGIEGWNISKFIDLDSLTPQLTTADMPTRPGSKNPRVKANIPTAAAENKIAQVKAVSPLTIVQFSRENKCKLETCYNEIEVADIEKGKKYCSHNCRHTANNNKRSTKSA